MDYLKDEIVIDNSSLANTHELHQTSLGLDLEVDFECHK